MSGERDRQKNGPSSPEGDTGNVTSGNSADLVDLDQLLNEISRSISSTQRHDEEHKAGPARSNEGPDDGPAKRHPGQSVLDFGESRPAWAGGHSQPNSTDVHMKGEKPMSRGVLMAIGAAVALSLLCGIGGLLVAFNASERIQVLQQNVDALQTKLTTMQVSSDPRVGQLQAEQAGIASKLEAMSGRLEGVSAAPAKGSETQLADLRKRLEALERKAPPVVKRAPSTPSKVPMPKASATPHEWTVILVSFPTQAQAESERSRLKKLGIHTEVMKSLVDDKPWYRVRVPDYSTQEAAKAAVPALERSSGISGAWVAHR